MFVCYPLIGVRIVLFVSCADNMCVVAFLGVVISVLKGVQSVWVLGAGVLGFECRCFEFWVQAF
jgi:hypothetical protein